MPPYLERFDIKTAVRFVDDMSVFTGLGWATNTKYLGRLRRYWGYLVKRTHISANPWTDLSLEKPSAQHDQQERSFTDPRSRSCSWANPTRG